MNVKLVKISSYFVSSGTCNFPVTWTFARHQSSKSWLKTCFHKGWIEGVFYRNWSCLFIFNNWYVLQLVRSMDHLVSRLLLKTYLGDEGSSSKSCLAMGPSSMSGILRNAATINRVAKQSSLLERSVIWCCFKTSYIRRIKVSKTLAEN